MNFIKEKKIHKYIVIPVLFLSFGFSGFHSVRGLLALVTASGSFAFNDIWSFALATIVGGGLYELITAILFRGAVVRLGARAADMRYALRIFFIPAMLLSGALKLLYLGYPFLFPYGEIFFDFIFVLVFFILFIIYSLKAYCRKEEYARITMFLGSSFLCVYGLIAVVSLLSGVL